MLDEEGCRGSSDLKISSLLTIGPLRINVMDACDRIRQRVPTLVQAKEPNAWLLTPSRDDYIAVSVSTPEYSGVLSSGGLEILTSPI